MAVLGAGGHPCAETVRGRGPRSWLGVHVPFECDGGAPKLVVPDSLRAGVGDP
ncbi:MAG TPA: hypothetical protein VKY90_04060 [Candidatus Dormibacteraeota bacterium]|nr:hypothetical protein [Candidatus Dormibacteraeota bacterium]